MEDEAKQIIDCLKLDAASGSVSLRIVKTYEITKTTDASQSNGTEAVCNPGPSNSQTPPNNVLKRKIEPKAIAPIEVKRKTKTIGNVFQSGNVLLVRVVWKAKRIAPVKGFLVLQVNFVDEDGEEICAMAWRERASELYDTLQVGHIYAITDVVKKERTWYGYSRLKDQKFELGFKKSSRFTDVTGTAFVPGLKYSFKEFHSIGIKDVCSVIGLVFAWNPSGKTMTLIDMKARTLRVDVSKSFDEIKGLEIVQTKTIVALIGIEKKEAVDRITSDESLNQVEAFTYQDTVFVIEPDCDETRAFLEWTQSQT